MINAWGPIDDEYDFNDFYEDDVFPRKRVRTSEYMNNEYEHSDNAIYEQKINIGQNVEEKKKKVGKIKKQNPVYNSGYYVGPKMILFFVILVVIFFSLVVWIIILGEKNSIILTKTQIGPQGLKGPAGLCNLTQGNQTFVLAGPLNISNNIRLDGDLIFDDHGFIRVNETCAFFDFPNICIENNISIKGSVNSNLTVDGCIESDKLIINEKSLFTTINNGDILVIQSGTAIHFNSSVQFNKPIILPLFLGPQNIKLDDPSSNGTLVIEVPDKVKIIGKLMINGPIVGPLIITEQTLFENGIRFDSDLPLPTQISIIDMMFTMYSELPIHIQSVDGSIWLNATVTIVHGDLIVEKNLKIEENVTSNININKNDPTINFIQNDDFKGSIGWDTFCLKIETSLLCLFSNVLFTGNTFLAQNSFFGFTNTNLHFLGTSKIDSDLEITGNLIIGGNFTIGDTLILNDLLVNGNATFNGPFSANSFDNFIKILTGDVIIVDTLFVLKGDGGIKGNMNFESNSSLTITNKLNIFSEIADVTCSFPIFSAQTLKNPNGNNCVLECPDFLSCTLRANNLAIANRFEVGNFGPNISTVPSFIAGSLGKPMDFFVSSANNTRMISKFGNYTQISEISRVTTSKSAFISAINFNDITFDPPLCVSNFTFSNCDNIFETYHWGNTTVDGKKSFMGNLKIKRTCHGPDATCIPGPDILPNGMNGEDFAGSFRSLTSFPYLDLIKKFNITTQTEVMGNIFDINGTLIDIINTTSIDSFIFDEHAVILTCIDENETSTVNILSKDFVKIGNAFGFNSSIDIEVGLGTPFFPGLTTFNTNVKISDGFTLKTDEISTSGDLKVGGDILDGFGATHPCCFSSRKLIVSSSTAATAYFNGAKVTFDTIVPTGSTLAASFTTLTSTFAAPVSGEYTITVYLRWDDTQSGLGTFRGVRLTRNFAVPTPTIASPVICAHPITSFIQTTCTYTAFFTIGASMTVHVFHDHGAGLNIFGGVGGLPAAYTRLEIIHHQ